MSVLISRRNDGDLYRDTSEEAHRIIRISEEVRISLEKVETAPPATTPEDTASSPSETSAEELTPAKLAA